jgi:hypothetical protein
MEASRAARNKRVEFEDMILNCITNDNESNITPSSSERHDRRNVPNRRHVDESQSTRSLAWQSLYGGDLNDDELDIAALISELEAPSRPNNRVASTDIDNERLYTTTIIPSITTDKPIGERGVSLLWKNYDWLRNKKIIQSERYANTKLFKLFTMRQQEEVRIRLPSLTEYGNIYDDDHLIINKIINLFDKWVNLISHENTDEIIDEKILLFIDKMKNDFPESNFNYREVYSKEASIRKAKNGR